MAIQEKATLRQIEITVDESGAPARLFAEYNVELVRDGGSVAARNTHRENLEPGSQGARKVLGDLLAAEILKTQTAERRLVQLTTDLNTANARIAELEKAASAREEALAGSGA